MAERDMTPDERERIERDVVRREDEMREPLEPAEPAQPDIPPEPIAPVIGGDPD